MRWMTFDAVRYLAAFCFFAFCFAAFCRRRWVAAGFRGAFGGGELAGSSWRP